MRHAPRWIVAALAAWWAADALPLPATPPMRPPSGPAESRPATLPALKAELAEKWLAYESAWRAGQWKKLDAAEGALYSRSLQDAGRWQLRSLAAEIERAYPSAPDDYRRCRLAYMILAARAKSLRRREPRPPPRPDEKAMNAFLAEWHAARTERAETALWGFRILEFAAGNIPDPRRKIDG